MGEVGRKYDEGKAPLTMIPREALEQTASVLAFGAKKYGRDNYKAGLEYTRLADAVMRHLVAWVNGEDIDPESNYSHLAHALAGLSMLIWMENNREDCDDRYKPTKD